MSTTMITRDNYEQSADHIHACVTCNLRRSKDVNLIAIGGQYQVHE